MIDPDPIRPIIKSEKEQLQKHREHLRNQEQLRAASIHSPQYQIRYPPDYKDPFRTRVLDWIDTHILKKWRRQ